MAKMDSRVISFIILFKLTSSLVYECDIEETVCETSLVVDYMLTMTHPKAGAVYVKDGEVYLHNDTKATTPENVSEAMIITADGSDNYRMVTVVNGTLPGPDLIFYEGQIVRINVINHLHTETVTIHWHGLHQVGSPWMDGVGFITQCPIEPNAEFEYQFVAKPKGTHWYHSHVGSQRANGLFGSLIIREKSQKGAKEHIMEIFEWNNLWDANMDFEKMLYGIFFNRIPPVESMSLDGGRFSRLYVSSALINGKGRIHYDNGTTNGAPLETFYVEPNSTYRFRIIGTGALYPFRVSFDEHMLTVMESDGHNLQPVTAESLIINPGERYDVLIYTNMSIKSYWIRAETLDSTAFHIAEAIMRYKGASHTIPTTQRKKCVVNNRCLVLNCPFTYFPETFYSDCMRFDNFHSSNTDIKVPNMKGENFYEYFLNFAFPGKTRTPASVNGRQFRFPPVSALTQPKQIETTCDTEDCGEEKLCFCTYSIPIKHDKTVQFIFLNMGNGRGWAHPIHLHGYTFHVLKMGYAEYDKATGKYTTANKDIDCRGNTTMDESFCNDATWRNISWLHGNVPDLKLENPPRKDTLIIPSGGYAVVRIQSNNPGVWIMHCHIDLHSSDGMAVIINNSFENHPTPPKNFPKCGSFGRFPSQSNLDCEDKGDDKTLIYVIAVQTVVILAFIIGCGIFCLVKRRH